MKSLPRPVLMVAVAVLVGVLSNLLFGRAPSRTVPVSPPSEVWHAGWSAQAGVAAADSIWQGQRSPWGAVAPGPKASNTPPPPSPAVPIGVATTGDESVAIFKLPNDAVARFAAGDLLPGGGKVLEVAGRRIVWLDASGEQRERVLFDAAANSQ